MRVFAASTCLAVAVATVGCGDGSVFAPPVIPGDPAVLAAGPSSASPESSTVFKGERSVAVTWEDLEFLRVNGSLESDSELAERVALRRALAAEAVLAGLNEDGGSLRVFRRALAQSLLKKKFEKEHTADTVPMERWEELYHEPGVLPMFDHYDTYFVLDLQMICCFESLPVCANSPAVQACMRDTEPKIWDAFERLSGAKHEDEAEVVAAMVRVRNEHYPDLHSQHYSFQYNFAVPHERQHGYSLMNRNIALAAKETAVHSLSRPVQSNHGWHILWIKDYLPEEHLKPGEPETVAKMKAKFYPFVKQKDVLLFLQSLSSKRRIEIYEEEIRSLDWGRLTGLR